MLTYTALFLALTLLLPSQDAHRRNLAWQSFRDRAFRSGGPNHWHYRWNGPSRHHKMKGGHYDRHYGGHYSFGDVNSLGRGSQQSRGGSKGIGTCTQQLVDVLNALGLGSQRSRGGSNSLRTGSQQSRGGSNGLGTQQSRGGSNSIGTGTQ